MFKRDRSSRRRSRSWSRSHSRSRSPADGRRSPGSRAGNSAEATSDPRTLDARVFVGSLTPEVTQEMLKKHFSKYGLVKGVLITKRKFGFVQFTTENESTKCLADGPIAMVEGRKIDVKPAKIRRPGEDGYGRGRDGREGGRMGRDRGGAGGVRGARRRDYDEGRSRQDDEYYHSYYRDEAAGGRSESGREHREPAAGYPDEYPDYYREYYDRYYRDPVPPVAGPPHPSSRDYHQPPVYSSDHPEPIDPLDANRPNDVEIVVPNKMQRGYAESIEMQLRRCGLLVDILFPPSDVSSSRVLADLAGRRCLYAVFVTSDNEKHRSITLNILHGTPQEHRNMPVDDALQLVQRDFEDYVKQARRRNAREIAPRDIRNLLLDLLESRNLSMADLDKLIKYLKERQNILVDDQIELKRETAGSLHHGSSGGLGSSSSRGGSSSQAITYPGYSYGGSDSAVAVGGSSSSGLPPQAPLVSMAAVTYPGLSAITPQAPPAPAVLSGHSQPPQQHGMQYANSYTTMVMQATSQHQQPPGGKAAPELKDRILSLMKSNAMNSVGGMGSGPPPVGVPPPVPAPTAVPPPMMHHSNPYGFQQGMPPKHDLKPQSVMQSQPPHYASPYQGWHQ